MWGQSAGRLPLRCGVFRPRGILAAGPRGGFRQTRTAYGSPKRSTAAMAVRAAARRLFRIGRRGVSCLRSGIRVRRARGIRPVFARRGPLSRYLDALNFQETSHLANYNKLRFLENHDQPRIASFVRDERARERHLRRSIFSRARRCSTRGRNLKNDHLPSLLTRTNIDRRTGQDLSGPVAPPVRGQAPAWQRPTGFSPTRTMRELTSPSSARAGAFRGRIPSRQRPPMCVDAADGV